MKGAFIDQSVLNYARSQAQVYCRDHADWLPTERYAVYAKTITSAIADVEEDMRCLRTLRKNAESLTLHRDALLVQTSRTKLIRNGWRKWWQRDTNDGYAQSITREVEAKPLLPRNELLHWEVVNWSLLFILSMFILVVVPTAIHFAASLYGLTATIHYTGVYFSLMQALCSTSIGTLGLAVTTVGIIPGITIVTLGLGLSLFYYRWC